MNFFGSIQLMLLGFIMLLVGFALPFLMMIQLLEPTFLLILLAYLSSVGGLVVGIIGSALYIRERQD
ncbi:hypothetical protein GC175_05535 [bacterium]|nr:hypothetical protein [bacterium]